MRNVFLCCASASGWDVARRRKIYSAIRFRIRCVILRSSDSRQGRKRFSMKKNPILTGFESKSQTYTICACALLMAMAIVLKTVLQFSVPMFGVKSQELNFSYSVIMFAGYVFGPLWGGIVGIGADLIGCLISGEGAPIIGLTVTNFFVGALPGILRLIVGDKYKKVYVLFPFTLILICLASLHNSVWIRMIYVPHLTYWVYALPRLAFSALIVFPLNAVIIWLLVSKILPLITSEKH